MLKEENKIFKNLYNEQGWELENALKRDDWLDTKKIIDKGRDTNEKSFLFVSSKRLIGYGFFELNNQINTIKKLHSRLIKINQNQNIENILNYIISKQKFKKLIPLNKVLKISTIE